MSSGESEKIAVIECREVTKVYKGAGAGGKRSVRALDDVSLRIGGGTIIGLIGPNGAGKTTLLSLIAGLLFPTGGTIRVCSHPARSLEARRSLGYVPESPAFLRKASIRFMHLCWLGTCAAIFLIPMPPGAWQWGGFVFGWCGCLLPLVLSAGIFGDDIASGRIRMVATEPIRLWELYVCRLLGLSLQGAAHILTAGALILFLHRLSGRGGIDRFALWLLASWLIFSAWAALCTSVSVVVRRDQNSMTVVLAAIAVVFPLYMLMLFFEDSIGTKVYHEIVRYAGPPVELLVRMGRGKCSLPGCLASVAHGLLLIALYSATGILLLNKREFTYVAD